VPFPGPFAPPVRSRERGRRAHPGGRV